MRRPPLTLERVLTSAMALADTQGLASLTMRKLGEVLGVEAMSLYNHVENKERLLDLLIDQVFAEIALPPPDVAWDEALRVRAHSARQVLVRHAWAVPLLESRTTPGPATLQHHDAVLGCLRGAGFSLAGAAHAVSVIDAYLYGFALQQKALPFENGVPVADVAASVMAQFPAHLYPHLAEFIADHALTPDYDFGREFEFGLTLVLSGLESMRRTDPTFSRSQP